MIDVLIAILEILLDLALIVAVVKYLERRKEQAGRGDSKDTEVFYTDWHSVPNSKLLKEDIEVAQSVLSMAHKVTLVNVSFEHRENPCNTFVRAKVTFKKVDKDEHN